MPMESSKTRLRPPIVVSECFDPMLYGPRPGVSSEWYGYCSPHRHPLAEAIANGTFERLEQG